MSVVDLTIVDRFDDGVATPVLVWRLTTPELAICSGPLGGGIGLRRWALNPTVLFSLGTRTSLLLGYEHLTDDRTADRGIPSSSGRPFGTEAGRFFGNADQSRAMSYVDGVYAILDHDFGGGWQLMRQPDGSYWRERTTTSGHLAVWLTGLLTFATTYLVGGVVSSLDRPMLEDYRGIAFIPVVGPFVAAGIASTSYCWNADGNSCVASAIPTYATLGVLQAAGFAMLVGGVAARKRHFERQPLLVMPAMLQTSASTGAGLSAIGRF